MVYAKRAAVGPKPWTPSPRRRSIDPSFAMIYVYRGKIHCKTGRVAGGRRRSTSRRWRSTRPRRRAPAIWPRPEPALLPRRPLTGAAPAHRRQRALPDSRRRRRHRNLPAQPARRRSRAIDPVNHYFVFTNRETGADLVPKRPNFHAGAAAGARGLAAGAPPLGADGLPLAARCACASTSCSIPASPRRCCARCPQVTVFHDLQHKRHPEYFRWFDLPFWNFFLFWSAHVSRLLLADSEPPRADLLRFYRLPDSRSAHGAAGRGPGVLRAGAAPPPGAAFCWPSPPCIRTRTWTACCAPSPCFRREHPEFRLVVCGLHGFLHRAAARACGSSWACGTRSSSPAGFRGRSSTISMRAPGLSSTLRASRASACPCWRRWRRAFPPRARRSNPWPALPATPPCNSIPRPCGHARSHAPPDVEDEPFAPVSPPPVRDVPPISPGKRPRPLHSTRSRSQQIRGN